MPIVLDGTAGISGAPISGTTGTFSGNVTANGLTTELRPLVLMTAQASTSGTVIDFTDIPSWVKRVTVTFNGVSTSGTSGIMIQIGSGSVSTSGYTSITSGFAATTLASGVATNSIFFFPASAASMLASGICNIVNQSSNVWVANGSVYRATDGIQNISSGAISLAGVLDRVRITTVNGTDTFDAGSINVMYE